MVLATPDLDAASDVLRDRCGLASIGGGRHPGWGTANRIVPVGDAYLELIAVVDDDVAPRSTFGRWVAAARPVVVEPLGWAVRTASVDAAARRHGLEVDAGSRTNADGQVLRWRLAGIREAAAEPCLPFFVEWGEGTPHPSRVPAAHRAGAVEVARVELDGDAARVAGWTDGQRLPIAVRPGPPAVTRLLLTTSTGELVLDSTLR